MACEWHQMNIESDETYTYIGNYRVLCLYTGTYFRLMEWRYGSLEHGTSNVYGKVLHCNVRNVNVLRLDALFFEMLFDPAEFSIRLFCFRVFFVSAFTD
jgi:hypothetical protein